MKVINAATTTQLEELHGLWGRFHEEVLPIYLDDPYLKELYAAEVFRLPDLEAKDQADIISITIAIQTIIHLVYPSPRGFERADALFEYNKNILEKHGVSFPFKAQLFELPAKNQNRYH